MQSGRARLQPSRGIFVLLSRMESSVRQEPRPPRTKRAATTGTKSIRQFAASVKELSGKDGTRVGTIFQLAVPRDAKLRMA